MEETFGQKLKSLRRSQNVSQRELAQRVDVDFSYISKIENDRLPPPAADRIVAICEVLGVDPTLLLSMTGKVPSQIQQNIGTSQGAQEFLREVQSLNLSDQEWKKMIRSLHNLRNQP